ncbi:hypothetical protein ACJIZ3_002835 [Penstemon smallii]|uniref:Uncharacterized protein n=1 Tax=Penstemon smallii TaxID=265156 RepID=A0ABD3U7I5_9LAMI
MAGPFGPLSWYLSSRFVRSLISASTSAFGHLDELGGGGGCGCFCGGGGGGFPTGVCTCIGTCGCGGGGALAILFIGICKLC